MNLTCAEAGSRLALSPPHPADFIHIHDHVKLPELLLCGWGLRSQAYCTVQAPSCKCGTEWALRSYPSRILGPFNECKADPRRSPATVPRSCDIREATAVPKFRVRSTLEPNDLEGDKGSGGRIKIRGSGSSCSILPVFERNQHLPTHLSIYPI